jgi:hypothetical protein
MPQPRVPTALLEARGGFLKHPERKRERADEPEPTGCLGTSPSYLGKYEKKVWEELSSKLAPGVAANSDEAAFEVLVCLVARFRKNQKKRLPPVVGELAAMNKLFTQFAMTPADRSRVKATTKKAKGDDPLADFVPGVQ